MSNSFSVVSGDRVVSTEHKECLQLEFREIFAIFRDIVDRENERREPVVNKLEISIGVVERCSSHYLAR